MEKINTEDLQQSNTQLNGDQSTNKSVYSIKPKVGTPFAVVKGEGKTKVVIGGYLAQEYENEQQANDAIENKDWQLIGALASVIAETYFKQGKQV